MTDIKGSGRFVSAALLELRRAPAAGSIFSGRGQQVIPQAVEAAVPALQMPVA
jgi:hypothetical protein